MLRPLQLLAAFAALAGRARAAAGTTGAWHLIDVQQFCPGSQGYTVVNISVHPGDVHTPHIFTIFRTSNEAVTVKFEVRDATGKIVADEKGLALETVAADTGSPTTAVPATQTVAPTTLQPTAFPPTETIAPLPPVMPTIFPPLPTMAPIPPLPTIAPMPVLPQPMTAPATETIAPIPPLPTIAPMPEQLLPTIAPPAQVRRLLGATSSRRRSGGGSSSSSPRRRSSSDSSPRRRSPTNYSPRRRSAPISGSPRRRGGSISGSPRRRGGSISGSPRRRGGDAISGSPRRRGGDAISGSPRRRGGDAISGSPRRRGSGGIIASPRRRGTSYSAPRRRGYAPAGVRRRTTGYGGNQYQNPYSPAAGYYGYPGQTSAYHNYGGRPPMSTPYGYSGANAYQGHSGAKIAMALAGGVAVGVAGSYLYNHWSGGGFFNPSHMSCSSGSWRGNCQSCTSMFTASSCFTELSPSFNAARDDLMGTGFVPADFVFPLTVNVTGVSGANFNPQLICPPAGWTPAMNSTWHPSDHSSIFIALTAMQELSAATGGGDGGGGSGSTSGLFGGFSSSSLQTALYALAGLFAACCCLVPLACCMASRNKKPQYGGWSSSSDSDDDHLPPPYVVAPLPPRPGYGHQGFQPQGFNGGGGYQSGGAQGFHGGQGFQPGGASRQGGFLSTASPGGRSWQDYCRGREVEINNSGLVDGAWGECMAWAKVYELTNPGWENNPEYRDEGPCGQVLNAMLEATPGYRQQQVNEAAQRLEEACNDSAERGQPLPIIGWRP